MGDPDRLRDRLEAGLLEEGGHLPRDLVEDAEAAREDRGADLDRARPRHDVLEGVPARSDAAARGTSRTAAPSWTISVPRPYACGQDRSSSIAWTPYVDIFAATAAYSSASLP